MLVDAWATTAVGREVKRKRPGTRATIANKSGRGHLLQRLLLIKALIMYSFSTVFDGLGKRQKQLVGKIKRSFAVYSRETASNTPVSINNFRGFIYCARVR
jgi:hypothetical protein